MRVAGGVVLLCCLAAAHEVQIITEPKPGQEFVHIHAQPNTKPGVKESKSVVMTVTSSKSSSFRGLERPLPSEQQVRPARQTVGVEIHDEGKTGVVRGRADNVESTIMEAKAEGKLSKKETGLKKDTRLNKDVEVRDTGASGVVGHQVHLGPGDLAVPHHKNIHYNHKASEVVSLLSRDKYEVIGVSSTKGAKIKDEGMFDFVDSPLSDKVLTPAGTSQASRINVKKGPNGQDYEYEYVYYYYDDEGEDEPANKKEEAKPEPAPASRPQEATPAPVTHEHRFPVDGGFDAEDQVNSVQPQPVSQPQPTPQLQQTHQQPIQQAVPEPQQPHHHHQQAVQQQPAQVGPSSSPPSRQEYQGQGYQSQQYDGERRRPEQTRAPADQDADFGTTRGRSRYTNIERGRGDAPAVTTQEPQHNEVLPTRAPHIRGRGRGESRQQTAATTTTESGRRGSVRRPSLELVDSSSFRTHPSDVPPDQEIPTIYSQPPPRGGNVAANRGRYVEDTRESDLPEYIDEVRRPATPARQQPPRQQALDQTVRHQPQQEHTIRHQAQPEHGIRHQPQPEQVVRHQPQPEQAIRPQPDVNVRHQIQPDLAIRHQAQPDLAIRHQPQPEHVIRHQPQPELSIRHQNQPDLTVRHQAQPDLAIRHQQPEQAIRHQPQPELAVRQPDVSIRHQGHSDIPARNLPDDSLLPVSTPRYLEPQPIDLNEGLVEDEGVMPEKAALDLYALLQSTHEEVGANEVETEAVTEELVTEPPPPPPTTTTTTTPPPPPPGRGRFRGGSSSRTRARPQSSQSTTTEEPAPRSDSRTRGRFTPSRTPSGGSQSGGYSGRRTKTTTAAPEGEQAEVTQRARPSFSNNRFRGRGRPGASTTTTEATEAAETSPRPTRPRASPVRPLRPGPRISLGRAAAPAQPAPPAPPADLPQPTNPPPTHPPVVSGAGDEGEAVEVSTDSALTRLRNRPRLRISQATPRPPAPAAAQPPRHRHLPPGLAGRRRVESEPVVGPEEGREEEEEVVAEVTTAGPPPTEPAAPQPAPESRLSSLIRRRRPLPGHRAAQPVHE